MHHWLSGMNVPDPGRNVSNTYAYTCTCRVPTDDNHLCAVFKFRGACFSLTDVDTSILWFCRIGIKYNGTFLIQMNTKTRHVRNYRNVWLVVCSNGSWCITSNLKKIPLSKQRPVVSLTFHFHPLTHDYCFVTRCFHQRSSTQCWYKLNLKKITIELRPL